jgi:hypothetical protein
MATFANITYERSKIPVLLSEGTVYPLDLLTETESIGQPLEYLQESCPIDEDRDNPLWNTLEDTNSKNKNSGSD